MPSPQTPGAIEGLERFDFRPEPDYPGSHDLAPDPDGDWVRLADVARLLSQAPEDRNEPVAVYFFGCMKGAYGFGKAGHYFYGEPPSHERSAPRKGNWLGEDVLPEAIRNGGKIDGPFCPHYAREKRYAKAKLTHRAGWTVLGMWDSSGDTRPGSDSNFFMQGTLSFEDALAEARRAFPEIIERCEAKYGPIELVVTEPKS